MDNRLGCKALCFSKKQKNNKKMNKQNATLVLNQYFPGFEMSLKCSFSAVLCPTPLCHLAVNPKLPC